MLPSDYNLKAELAGLRYLLQASNSQDVVSEKEILPIMRNRCRDVLRSQSGGKNVTPQHIAEAREILQEVEDRIAALKAG